MKRGGPLKRRKRLKSRSWIKPKNQERAKRRRERDFGLQAKACRESPCCACGGKAPSHPHHVRSRGAGGRDRDTVPLCSWCHAAIHAEGMVTFQIRHGLDLAAIARRIHDSLANDT